MSLVCLVTKGEESVTAHVLIQAASHAWGNTQGLCGPQVWGAPRPSAPLMAPQELTGQERQLWFQF